jgi:hypothetical protein
MASVQIRVAPSALQKGAEDAKKATLSFIKGIKSMSDRLVRSDTFACTRSSAKEPCFAACKTHLVY